MPDVLDWSPNEALLDRIGQSLRQGGVVVLPTEAGYEGVASALDAAAVATLADVAVAAEPLAVVLGEAAEVFDWLPHFRGVGLRLARAFWPGPITLVCHGGATGLCRALPAESAKNIMRRGLLAVRVPDHTWPRSVSRLLAGPMVSAPLHGLPREVGALQAPERFSVIVNDGPSPLAEPPTLVKIDGKSAVSVRPGAVPRPDVEAVLACRILFVCAGNTCRSPLAEALCRTLLSASLRCSPSDLAARGYLVQSAGTAAAHGNPANPEAVATALTYGADLTGHRSRPLSRELLSQADLTFTMTASQHDVLSSLRLSSVAQMLDPGGADVDDPIGGSDAVYRACAEQIWQNLNQRLPELLEA